MTRMNVWKNEQTNENNDYARSAAALKYGLKRKLFLFYDNLFILVSLSSSILLFFRISHNLLGCS